MIFSKMQGAGNDFVVNQPGPDNMDWPQIARQICDRHFGIGADGLILALPSKAANLRMRIFNPDGSEAETCGNGLRCLARFAVINSLIKAGTKQITIETIPGIRKINLGYNGGELSFIQVGIGVPKFTPSDMPLKAEAGKHRQFEAIPILDYELAIEDIQLSLSFVSMGNPHAVHFIQNEVSEYPLIEIGPQVEHHPLFPRRTNFEVARVVNRHKIEMRVWERGAGETLACGTGACAVAVAAQLHGYIDEKVDITLPGGTLNIEWNGKDEVLMSGPAEVVFTGEWKGNIDG
jgi:diaminopimelate epimerase